MRLFAFDNVALTQYEIDDDIPLEFVSAGQTLPGQAGAYDAFGHDQVRAPLTITRNFELIGSSYADIDTQLDALRNRANLGLRWLEIEMRDLSVRGTWAKLKRVQSPNRVGFLEHLPVTLTFEITWPWFEDVTDIWYLDAGEVLDNSLTFDRNYSTRSGAGTLTITNNGGDAIRRGLMVIVGASTNPSLTNAANGYSISYSGTVAAGSTLFIDIGAQTAWLDGASAWPNITLGADQIDFFKLMDSMQLTGLRILYQM